MEIENFASRTQARRYTASVNLKRLLTVAALLATIAATAIWNALEWPEPARQPDHETYPNVTKAAFDEIQMCDGLVNRPQQAAGSRELFLENLPMGLEGGDPLEFAPVQELFDVLQLKPQLPVEQVVAIAGGAPA